MSLRSVILIALSEEELSGYEITKEFETVLGYFWSASHQQVYRELGKMDQEGLVTWRLEPQDGKPDRKVYAVTDLGREALQRWLEASTPQPAVRSPLLVKVYAGMILGPPQLREHVDAFHKETLGALRGLRQIQGAHYAEEVDDMEAWKKLAYLTLRFGILRKEADAQWAAEAQELLQSIAEPTKAAGEK